MVYKKTENHLAHYGYLFSESPFQLNYCQAPMKHKTTHQVSKILTKKKGKNTDIANYSNFT